MDKVLRSLRKRVMFAVVCLVAIGSWLTLCSKHYESYWNGTIKRVQTVDFNMLHHMLPTTLSYLILAGKDDAIQQVLDSNYGIFGMVVTDPNGEDIVYKSEKVYKHKTWQKDLSLKFLNQGQKGKEIEHYDLLTDPPPVAAQWANDSPRTAADSQVGQVPKGRVIGRVYYVREPPPPFFEDLFSSLWGNWFEFTGSRRGYMLHTLNVLSFSLAAMLIFLWRKQILENKEKELEKLEKELAIKRRTLDTLSSDLKAQRTRKEWLENEAERAYDRAYRLKESLKKLKDAFFLLDNSPGTVSNMDPDVADVISVRPPMHPPSLLIEEIEGLLPDLTNNAKILKSQAEVLQTYCTQLEVRQTEMQKMLDRGKHGPSGPAAGTVPGTRSPMIAEQPTP